MYFLLLLTQVYLPQSGCHLCLYSQKRFHRFPRDSAAGSFRYPQEYAQTSSQLRLLPRSCHSALPLLACGRVSLGHLARAPPGAGAGVPQELATPSISYVVTPDVNGSAHRDSLVHHDTRQAAGKTMQTIYRPARSIYSHSWRNCRLASMNGQISVTSYKCSFRVPAPVHHHTLAEETGEGVKRNIFGFRRASQFLSVQSKRNANICK